VLDLVIAKLTSKALRRTIIQEEHLALQKRARFVLVTRVPCIRTGSLPEIDARIGYLGAWAYCSNECVVRGPAVRVENAERL